MDDLISRAAVVGAIKAYWKKVVDDIPKDTEFEEATRLCDLALEHNAGILKAIDNLPSAQPEPLSDAYMKAVWTWLLDYQIKAAELKGRYTPYEVLSWVANDWRKEHDGSD